MALVTCDKVGSALTNWIVNATVEEREALCDALSCGVEISPDEWNQLELRPNGLYSKPHQWDNKEW